MKPGNGTTKVTKTVENDSTKSNLNVEQAATTGYKQMLCLYFAVFPRLSFYINHYVNSIDIVNVILQHKSIQKI